MLLNLSGATFSQSGLSGPLLSGQLDYGKDTLLFSSLLLFSFSTLTPTHRPPPALPPLLSVKQTVSDISPCLSGLLAESNLALCLTIWR